MTPEPDRREYDDGCIVWEMGAQFNPYTRFIRASFHKLEQGGIYISFPFDLDEVMLTREDAINLHKALTEYINLK